MIKEKSYKYKNYQISYDEGLKDRSALMIGVKEKDTLYITGELYDESAHMVIEILNNLENENKRLHTIIKEVRELAIIKKTRVENEPDYSKSYLEGYENAIQTQHLTHSGVMLETIKSTIKVTCDDFLEILDKEKENE